MVFDDVERSKPRESIQLSASDEDSGHEDIVVHGVGAYTKDVGMLREGDDLYSFDR